MVRLLAVLVLLRQGCHARRFATMSDYATREGDEANTDRVQCLRQDNLDLVAADANGRASEYILRKAIAPEVSAVGLRSDSTGNDVYIFVKELLIRHIEANLDLKRVGESEFEFTLTGNDAYQDTAGVGKADIWLSGFRLVTPSKLISWAAALAANTDVLQQGQDGTLYFSLSGRVRAKIGEKGAWEVDLVDTDVELFKFRFSSQATLETALNKWGGLDKVLLDGLFGLVKMAMSPSVLAAMQFIPMKQGVKDQDQEFWLSVSVSLAGSMDRPNKELNLDTSLSVIAHVQPAKLIQVFMEHFNITAIAERKVEQFLSDPAVLNAWQNNRGVFVENLKQYRLLAGDLLDFVQNVTELDVLRPRLLKAAADLADSVTQALQPFVRAYAQGKSGYTEKFRVRLEGSTGWDTALKDGLLWANLRPSRIGNGAVWLRDFKATSAKEDLQLGGTSPVEFVWVPLDLLDVFGLGGLLQAPSREKVTGLKVQNASFDFSELKVSNMAIWNFLRWIGSAQNQSNDTDPASVPQDLMEIASAELADVSLRLPSVFKPKFAEISLFSKELAGELTSKGVLTLSSLDGFEAQFDERPGEVVTGTGRQGLPDTIDGPIEKWLARPSTAGPGLSRKVASPEAAGGIYLEVSGSAGGLSLDLRARTQVTANLGTVLGSFLAGRPTEDFGYAFFADHLTWQRKKDGTEEIISEFSVATVLNCGYLRLLEFPLRTKPLARLDMNNGQLELDLTKYTASPKIVQRPSGQGGTMTCLMLYSSGYEAPKVGSWLSSTKVQDFVCGSQQKIDDLSTAIDLQLRRFRDPRARMWDFGTHNATEKAQHLLTGGRATMDLVEILAADPENLRSENKPDVPSSERSASSEIDVSVRQVLAARGAETNDEAFNTAQQTVQTAEVKMHHADLSDEQGNRPYIGREISRPSPDALKCRAEEALDGKHFPPEEYGDAAIRMSIPESPLDDIYVVVEKIQVMDVKLDIAFKRVSDESFLFEIGTAEKHAKLNFWVEGLGLKLPNSKVEDILKFGSGFENFVGRVFGNDNLGRLDQGPLTIDLHIKGEFSLDANGRWKINSKRAVSQVDIRFGAGGVLQAVINYLIAHFGNMDKIFADNVWPLITSLIPDKVGLAFTKVPSEFGQIDNKFAISAQCKTPVKNAGCSGDEVKFRMTTVDTLRLKPEPILKDLIQTQYISNDWVVSGFMQAWQEGKLPLKSSIVHGNLDLSHRPEEFLQIRGAGDTQLNMVFLETLLGNDSLVLDVVPGIGQLSVEGNALMQLQKGMIDLPKLRIEKARLPFTIGAGDGRQALELDVTLQKFQAKVLNESKSDIESVVLNLDMHADREKGFHVKSDGKAGPPIFDIAMDKHVMRDLLDVPAKNWSQPANARLPGSDAADGMLPRKFRKRFGQRPSVIDLNGMLRNTRAEIDVSLEGLEASGGQETLQGKIEVTLEGTLQLGSSVWKGFLQRHESDTGFVHFSSAGTYKDAPALLEIGCGRLVIYELGKAQPRKEVMWEVELANTKPDHPLYSLSKMENEKGEKCLYLKTTYKAVHFWKKYERTFCPQKASDLDKLVEALDLQFRRFNDHLDASKRAKLEDERSRNETVEAGLGLPEDFFSPRKLQRDTTWLRRLNPYDATSWYPNRPPPEVVDEDVETPTQRWRRATQQMRLAI
eukprot:TRINITY_DN9664_c0_g2_i3.p1 TRINITY_DN9664_c0_g2~~TRINITY_DN9664_c0_g2_i3.p1  ORF type:complete len:1661 (+),score=331.72 TRINITY_DN9664_c0_g2_i3:71-5053(+)